MSIEHLIKQACSKAVYHLYKEQLEPESITLQQTRKEFEGEFTIVAFPFTKFSKKSPDATAEEIGKWLKTNLPSINSFNVVKGFLNLSLTDQLLIETISTISTTTNYGTFPSRGQKVMVEYSSPNTNKPLHLGHVRNILLGYSIAEILNAYGYEVIKANLINDRGIHICKSMLAWKLFGKGETPASSGLKGDHLVGKYYVIFDTEYKKEIETLKSKGLTEDEAKKQAPLIRTAQEMLLKWEEGDKEVIDLWKLMNSWVYEGFDITYKNLGVDFNKFYYESDTYLLGKEIVEEGLAKKVLFKKEDGSVWIDLTAEGFDEKLLLRSDGTSVYMTQDLGTAQLKYNDYNMEKSIYVVGNEQDYHFKVLFLILQKLGKTWAQGLYHLSYGMVDLPSGKMKSREGTVVDADELMSDMIIAAAEQTAQLGKTNDFSKEEKENLHRILGMGALKYFLLKVEPKKRLLFNPAESIDLQGHTGPFIQYSYARIRSILRKAAELNHVPSCKVKNLYPGEKSLMLTLYHFPAAIKEAADNYSPAILANYLYELAKSYNKFYHDEPILKAENPDLLEFRLLLSELTGEVIKKGMKFIGIEVPERM